MSLLVLAAAAAAATPACSAEHAAMGHCTLPEPAAQPAPPDHTAHSGHAGHMGGAKDPPVTPPPEAALAGPEFAADALFGADEMRRAREQLRREHGAVTTSMVMVDMLEARMHGGRDGYAWDMQAFTGSDVDRLRVKSEGEGTFGSDPERAELQALWSHALDPWFNLHAGLRYDLLPGADRAYLAIGAQGLARYWFEVDGSMFLYDRGDISARVEASYDQRITRKLILQPRAEADLTVLDGSKNGDDFGLSSTEVGVRLRYEFVPEFAPYIGATYERAFAANARAMRAQGDRVGGWQFVSGVRVWF